MTEQDKTSGLWFLNNHCRIPVPKASNADGISVIQMRLPAGDAPPLHVHREEDEIFHVLEGEVRFQVGDRTTVARTGDTLVAPRGVPHGFRVLSSNGAEMLTITRGGFEDMVRAVAQPAGSDDLPEMTAPSPALQDALTAACAANGIDLLGPPIG
jgi:quercetin dioxygenase-like cupin family protein